MAWALVIIITTKEVSFLATTIKLNTRERDDRVYITIAITTIAVSVVGF